VRKKLLCAVIGIATPSGVSTFTLSFPFTMTCREKPPHRTYQASNTTVNEKWLWAIWLATILHLKVDLVQEIGDQGCHGCLIPVMHVSPGDE
jgi:hypothetical protein